MRVVLLGVSAMLLLGCTHQQMYNTVQENRRLDCRTLAGSALDECLNAYRTPYVIYERERQRLHEDQFQE